MGVANLYFFKKNETVFQQKRTVFCFLNEMKKLFKKTLSNKK